MCDTWSAFGPLCILVRLSSHTAILGPQGKNMSFPIAFVPLAADTPGTPERKPRPPTQCMYRSSVADITGMYRSSVAVVTVFRLRNAFFPLPLRCGHGCGGVSSEAVGRHVRCAAARCALKMSRSSRWGALRLRAAPFPSCRLLPFRRHSHALLSRPRSAVCANARRYVLRFPLRRFPPPARSIATGFVLPAVALAPPRCLPTVRASFGRAHASQPACDDLCLGRVSRTMPPWRAGKQNLT